MTRRVLRQNRMGFLNTRVFETCMASRKPEKLVEKAVALDGNMAHSAH